jgi:hypothetical protein
MTQESRRLLKEYEDTGSSLEFLYSDDFLVEYITGNHAQDMVAVEVVLSKKKKQMVQAYEGEEIA